MQMQITQIELNLSAYRSIRMSLRIPMIRGSVSTKIKLEKKRDTKMIWFARAPNDASILSSVGKHTCWRSYTRGYKHYSVVHSLDFSVAGFSLFLFLTHQLSSHTHCHTNAMVAVFATLFVVCLCVWLFVCVCECVCLCCLCICCKQHRLRSL